MRRWPKTVRCEAPGCTRTREVKGLCRMHYSEHYRRWRQECQSNGSLTAATEDVLPAPKWEWPGDEAELAARVERQEEEARQ